MSATDLVVTNVSNGYEYVHLSTSSHYFARLATFMHVLTTQSGLNKSLITMIKKIYRPGGKLTIKC